MHVKIKAYFDDLLRREQRQVLSLELMVVGDWDRMVVVMIVIRVGI